MTDAGKAFFAENPSCAELTAILGKGWAIARNTERNRERYGRCITRAEYEEAKNVALTMRALKLLSFLTNPPDSGSE